MVTSSPIAKGKLADKSFKLVLLGDSSVGKSSLVCRFVKHQFHENEQSTVGASFFTQDIAVDGEGNKVKFSIWDTAGQERFAPLAPMYYRGANAALVVFDIVNPPTFQKAQFWVQELQCKGSPNVVIALAGNKCDLGHMRKVSSQEAQQFANTNGILYFETSAKTAENVNAIFVALAKKLSVGNEAKPSLFGGGEETRTNRDNVNLNRPANPQDQGCCG